MHPILTEIEAQGRRETVDKFDVGDTVDVHVRIVEGEKERIQIFTGVVIGRKGRGLNESFTVRRLVQGTGVERVFPLHSPRVEKVEVKRQGRARRAKLYFLRERIGKATRLRDETRGERSGAKPSRKREEMVVPGEQAETDSEAAAGTGEQG